MPADASTWRILGYKDGLQRLGGHLRKAGSEGSACTPWQWPCCIDPEIAYLPDDAEAVFVWEQLKAAADAAP